MKVDASTANFTAESLPPAEQERLACILDEYLAAIEQGAPICPDDLLIRYPADAERLRAYLSGLELFHVAAAAAPAARSLSVGRDAGQSVGDFALIREIGRGGMGVVYEATQRSLRRRVALKVLPFTSAHEAKHIARFKNEAQAAAQAQHPNIVPVYAIGEEEGVHYYAMQLIEGQSLASLVRRRTSNPSYAHASSTLPNNTRTAPAQLLIPPRQDPLPHAIPVELNAEETAAHVRAVARMAIQAAQALHAAHEYGVIHRDVKPSNLLVDQNGKVWVTDFGLARCRETAGLTQTGDVLGTMRYMSPEQALGQAALIDHRTDIYSLGMTLYELATFTHPAEGAGDVQLFFERTRSNYRSPRHWNHRIPADFETIVMKAMAEFPQDRYATAEELADDLQRFLDGQPIHASRPSLANRGMKWAKRHRAAVYAAAGVLGAAMIGLVAAVILISSEKAVAVEANQRVEENLRLTREVLDQYIRMGEQLASIPGAEGVRRQSYETGIEYYRQVANQAVNDPSLAADLGLAYNKIGVLTAKIGDQQQALQFQLDAQRTFEQLLATESTNPEYGRRLALCYNNTGLLLAEMGRADEGLALLRQAEHLQTRMSATHGDSPELSADVAASHSNLGLVLSRTGAQAEAAKEFGVAIAIQSRLLKESPENEEVARNLAISYGNLGSSLETSDPKLAAQRFGQAIGIQQKLLADDPLNQLYQSGLAGAYNNLGYILSRSGRWVKAEDCYLEAIAYQEELAKTSHQALHHVRDLAVSYNNLGMVQSHAGNVAGAETSFSKALAKQRGIIERRPNDARTLSDLGGVYNNLAMLLDGDHRRAEAESAYLQAIKCQRQALSLAGDRAAIRELLSKHYYNYAQNLIAQKRASDALRVARKRGELWAGAPERLCTVAEQLMALRQQVAAGPGVESAVVGEIAGAAIDTLQEAVTAGLSVERLQSPAFAPLAERADFRQLRDAQPVVEEPSTSLVHD